MIHLGTKPKAVKPGVYLRALLLFGGLLPVTGYAQTTLRLSPGRDFVVVGAGAVLHGIGLWQHSLPQPSAAFHGTPAQLPGIDRGTVGNWSLPAHHASNILLGAAAAASLATVVWNQHGERPLEPVAIVGESVLLASGLTNTVKEMVQRPRPYLYDADLAALAGGGHGDLLSFWSGHTANVAALTFSTAYMVQHSNASAALKTGTWVAAALVPAAMGYLRVRAGRHFPTDVLAGYAVGAAVGIAVPFFHRQQQAH